jgi:hypothetical protein
LRWPWVPPTSTEKIAPRKATRKCETERHTILIELVRSDATGTGLQFAERLGDIIAHDGDGPDFLVCEKPTKTLK